MGRSYKLDERKIRTLVELYRSGKVSLKDLGTRYEMSLEGIRQVLLRNGVEMNAPYKTIGRTGRKPKYS